MIGSINEHNNNKKKQTFDYIEQLVNYILFFSLEL